MTLLDDVYEWVFNSNIFDETYQFQMNVFEEDLDHKDGYVVIRSDGGTDRVNDLSNELNVLIQVVSSKLNKADAYFKSVQLNDYAIGHSSYERLSLILPTGGEPSPILTEDGRHVYLMSFRVLTSD